MAEALKDSINKKYISSIAHSVAKHHTKFKIDQFVKTCLADGFSKLELKERQTRICVTLQKFLPEDYKQAVEILMKTSVDFGNYQAMLFPEFAWRFGRAPKHKKISQKALIHFTQYSSSEFAVRPFIEDDLTGMMAWMLKLSKHKNYHVRRLASEGCRPRLPWAPALVELKKDPRLILPILENLKDDPELYVRRSVANNINDIAKDHPEVVIKMIRKWQKKQPNENIQWVIKHGLRSLVKQGNPQALGLLGYKISKDIEIKNFSLVKSKIELGEGLNFKFNLKNSGTKKQSCMIDFVVFHKKKNGSHQAKVFKLKSLTVPPKSTVSLKKIHPMKKINTRQYYGGEHFIGIQVNGKLGKKIKFDLLV